MSWRVHGGRPVRGWRAGSQNLAMIVRLDYVHRPARHSMSEASIGIIAAAQTVEVMVFSPDGDPLATVEVSKAEAMRLVSLPTTMGHVFSGQPTLFPKTRA